MSKVNKKTGCVHKFVQGPKKGKKCNAPCRNGKLCKTHNKKRLESKKIYYETRKEKTKNDSIDTKINKILQAKTLSEIPDPNIYRFKMLRIIDDKRHIQSRIFGIRQFLGEDITSDLTKYIEKVNPGGYWINRTYVRTYNGSKKFAKQTKKQLIKKIHQLSEKYIVQCKIKEAIEKRVNELLKRKNN